MSKISIYTDGSYKENHGVPSITYAYVILKDGKVIEKENDYLDRNDFKDYYSQRNVLGEIMAVLLSLTSCERKGYSDVTIYHDYRGVADWATGDWKAKNRLTQYYVTYIKALGVNVKFVHVKSHTGDKYNEMVDSLANECHCFKE